MMKLKHATASITDGKFCLKWISDVAQLPKLNTDGIPNIARIAS